MPRNFVLKICLVKIDNPMEARMMTDNDANTSNLTNAELTYTPAIPIINTKDIESLFREISDFEIFLCKISQTPSAAKIINMELK